MGYGLALGLGGAFQQAGRDIHNREQEAIAKALQTQQLQLREAEELRQKEEAIRAAELHKLNVTKTQHELDQLPVRDARESIKLGMDFNPNSFINAPNTPDLLKQAGIPFQQAPPEQRNVLDVAENGLFIPPAVKQLIEQQRFLDVPVPPEYTGQAAYRARFGANPVVDTSQGSQYPGGFGEFVVKTPQQSEALKGLGYSYAVGQQAKVPNPIGAALGMEPFHQPPLAFLPAYDNQGNMGAFSRTGGSFTPVQNTATGEQVKAQPPAALKGQAVALSPLYGALDTFKMLSATVNTEMGWGAYVNGMKRYAGAMAKRDPDAQRMMAENNMFDSTLARLKGEVGVLTEQDVQRARSFMPTIWDDKMQAQWKLQKLEEFLADKVNALNAFNVPTDFLNNNNNNNNPAGISNIRPAAPPQ